VVRQPFGEHVIGADENLVGDGEGRAHGAAPGLETVEFVFEVAAPCPRGGDRGADQHRAEVDIALSGAAALLPAGALVAAGTDAGPGAQVIDAQEHAHLDADLGDEHRGDEPVDTGDLHQKRVRRPVRFEPFVDAQVERCDVLLDRFEPAQLGGEEEPMMLLHSPLERQDEIGALASQLALGEIRPGLDRRLTLDQRPKHRPARYAEDVAHYARQLDVGRFQELQQPVALGRLALGELAAVAQQLSHFPKAAGAARSSWRSARVGPDRRSTRHPSRPSAPRHVADVPSVADDQVEMPFEHGIDRPPSDAGALHADMRHPRPHEPVPQGFKVSRHRTERTYLLRRSIPGAPIRRHATTVSWCTSNPQHRSIITRIIASCH
jgi:hypothetical protein